jgi:hypothetical protein
MVHTYNLSGTDVTVTFGSNSVTFSGDLHVLGDLYVTDVFVSSADSGIISTNNVDTASAQTAIFQGDRATPTDNDTGYISFKLSDDAGTQSEFARISWVAPDVSVGSIDGLLKFGVVTANSLSDFMTLGAGALALGTNNLTMTGSLGATGARLTKGWFIDLEVTNDIVGDITGNAGTVTNGVYTTGNQSIAGIKTFSDATEASNATTGGTIVSGGLAVAKRVYATDMTVTNKITGSISGNADGTASNLSGTPTLPSGTTLVAPVLGTPASGTLTNCTFPTFNQDTTGKSAKTDALNSATTVVNVSSATAPIAGQVLMATANNSATWQNRTGTIGITIDGGGSAITTGSKGFIYIPYACTISSATLLADQSGSIVIDVKKVAYGSFPTTASICASALPTLSTAQNSQDSTLTGWTKTISAGDVIEFEVSGTPTSVTRVSLILAVAK